MKQLADGWGWIPYDFEPGVAVVVAAVPGPAAVDAAVHGDTCQPSHALARASRSLVPSLARVQAFLSPFGEVCDPVHAHARGHDLSTTEGKCAGSSGRYRAMCDLVLAAAADADHSEKPAVAAVAAVAVVVVVVAAAAAAADVTGALEEEQRRPA